MNSNAEREILIDNETNINEDDLRRNIHNILKFHSADKVIDIMKTIKDADVQSELENELGKNICNILKFLSGEQVKEIIKTLKDVGVESLSDLKLVHEEDLSGKLKPVQIRKLICAWNQQFSCTEQVIVQNFSTKENILKNSMDQEKEQSPLCHKKLQDYSEKYQNAPNLSEQINMPPFVTPLLRDWGKRKYGPLLEIYSYYKPQITSLENMQKSIHEQMQSFSSRNNISILYKEKKSVSKKLKILWEELADEMKKTFSVNWSGEVCRNKIVNLKKNYESIKSDCRKFGISLTSKHYLEMDRTFGSDGNSSESETLIVCIDQMASTSTCTNPESSTSACKDLVPSASTNIYPVSSTSAYIDTMPSTYVDSMPFTSSHNYPMPFASASNNYSSTNSEIEFTQLSETGMLTSQKRKNDTQVEIRRKHCRTSEEPFVFG